jgi:hypothetical protein
MHESTATIPWLRPLPGEDGGPGRRAGLTPWQSSNITRQLLFFDSSYILRLA